MRLEKVSDRYVLRSSYEERDHPKRAGFRWDKFERVWWTPDPGVAARLAAHGDATLRAELAASTERQEATLEASRAVASDLDIPVPHGLEYLPYQRAGIAFASSRPATLIADEMGLGKTIQAIGVVNADDSIQGVLVVCPASLKLNWKRELEKWLVRPLSVGIADAKLCPATDVVIANYDILHKHDAALYGRASGWDLLVVDEAHYAKNPKARRSKQVYAVAAKRRLFLTGTPIVNRPIELFPIVNAIDPDRWPKFFPFARRYANAFHNGYGWDFSGAKNLDELQERLRSTIMVRRLKKDVLTELPPKRRQIVELDPNGAATAIERERDAIDETEATVARLEAEADVAKGTEAYEAAVARLQEARQVAFAEMSRLRHETALAKVPKVLEHLHAAIDDDPEAKLVVFAHHKDVLAQIAADFGAAAVVLTGDTPQAERQRAVDSFQTDPSVRLFVGSLTAAGVGLTLTASAHVVFAELDWVPGNVTQAEDRTHRIGQRNSVLIQHLVFDGSLDSRMARTIVAKQNVIDQALDVERQVAEPPDEKKTNGNGAAAVDEPPMTDERTATVHEALRFLAARCDGARALDGAGFNKLDAHFGRSLAEAERLTAKQASWGFKLVRKYRRQLPAELAAACGL